MKQTVCFALMLCAVLLVKQSGGSVIASPGQTSTLPSVDDQRALKDQYCVGCHSEKQKSGGFSWTELDVARPEQNAELTEKVIRKVRSGMMPPAGARRPDLPTMKAFAAALESKIDQAAAAHPYIGAPELHRVNRTEYRNSVHDLLGLDEDVTELLPPDARTNGFDNMSDALTITPALMSSYVRAADKISRDAIGDAHAAPAEVSYKVSRLINQMHRVEGAPLGTRGGLAIMHTFPADGDYTFKADFYYYYTEQLIGSSLPAQLQGQEIEFSVDGERVASLTIDPSIQESQANYVTQPVHIAAGQRRLAAAFVSKFDGPVQDHYRLIEQTLLDTTISVTPELTGLPHLQALHVTGPFNPTGVSDSVTRRKVFTCRPVKASDEEPCATQIVSKLAAQAFRRPVNAEDLESLMSFYQYGRKEGSFDEGIRAAIQAILSKPEFIFRFEHEPANAAPGQSYRIGDLELASRLAYFLWSTVPDEQLVAVAKQGKLKDAAVLEQQVKRMLLDPRSEALATNFAGQWLRLAGMKDVFPEAPMFPNFTRNLADSMRREVELLFESVMHEDRNVLDLLTADYTFVDEVLAKHYGIPNITGTRFKRVQLSDPNRFGLLGKAGILTMTSLSNRTSPVARGKYVLEVLVGSPPPSPPPVVPRLKEIADNEKVVTVRERMEAHRANAVCAACHKIMDPIGLALENFDPIGGWRVNDGGTPVDPSGQLFDGTKLDGPAGVRQAILKRSDAFLNSITENLLSYGLGRVIDYRDMPTVRTISRGAAGQNNRFSAFILGVVKSAPFQMRAVMNTTVDRAAERR
jgi:hypothetical protein